MTTSASRGGQDRTLMVLGVDWLDHGAETILAHAQGMGCSAIALTANYHDGRYTFPRNPQRVVSPLEGDVAFFQPKESYPRGLRPVVSDLVGGRDLLDEACAQAAEKGLQVDAWTIYLHSERFVLDAEDWSTRNAFGDRPAGDLCPSNTDVRQYVHTLTRDIFHHSVRSIVAETINFKRYPHGYHHERNAPGLSAFDEYLLGLCFCESCVRDFRAQGGNAEPLRRRVTQRLRTVLNGQRLGDEAELRNLLHPYESFRMSVVTRLVEEIVDLADGRPVRVIDPSGAVLGYDTGVASGGSAAAIAVQCGMDHRGLARAGVELIGLGYTRDPERLAAEIDGLAVGCGDSIGVAIRPCPPDVVDAEDLERHLAVLDRDAVRSVLYYVYGFMRELDIESLLASAKQWRH